MSWHAQLAAGLGEFAGVRACCAGAGIALNSGKIREPLNSTVGTFRQLRVRRLFGQELAI
jgi:hypothetical protein